MPSVSYTDIIKNLEQSEGTINAVRDGEEIFKSESVYYRLHGSTMFIIGDKGPDHVALCAPTNLNLGPHTVVYPQDFIKLPNYLIWTIRVNDAHHYIEKGTLTITFGPDKASAKGSYHVTLKGTGEEIGGNFKMSNV